MTNDRVGRRLWYAMFAVLAVALFSAMTASAENVRGKFTLPYATYWGGTLLSQGDYNFNIDTTGERPMLLTSAGHSIYVKFGYIEQVTSSARSQIVIANDTNRAMVHILYLASTGTAFHFNVPQRYEVTTKILTSNAGSPRIDRIPITAYGK